MSRRSFAPEPPSKDKLRVIERPWDGTVRLIDEEGTQVGILSVREALDVALERGLDLVEIAPQADPPTCKLLDYGKYKYQQKKKQHKSKTKTASKRRKEIKLRPKTEEHDLQVKLKHAKEFIAEGHKVLITMVFRGRELRYTETGVEHLKKFAQAMEDVAKVEKEPTSEGRNRIGMILVAK